MNDVPDSERGLNTRQTPSLAGWRALFAPEPELVPITAWLVGAISALALAATSLKDPFQTGFAVASVLGLAASAASLLAHRSGKHRASAYWLAITVWMAVAIGNLDEPGASGFVIASLVAGLTLGSRAAILAALGGSAVLALFGVAGEGVAEWGHYVVILLGGASLVALVSHRVTLALDRERETNKRYRTLVEEQPLGVFATDCDLNIVMANQACATLLGFESPEEFIGRHLSAGAAFEVPEFRALADRVLNGGRGVAEAGFTTIRGKTVVLRIHGAPVHGDDGAVVGCQGVCEDISSRVEAERALHESQARFRAITEGDIDQVTELRADDSHAFISPNSERLFGVDLKAVEFREHLYRKDTKLLFRATKRVRETDRPERVEYRIIDSSGAIRWVESSIAPFLAADGEQRLIVVSRDITQRRLLQDELGQVQKMEAVGQLAAGVAHDFNNLLTAIGGNAEMLLESETLAEADQESAGEILAATDRAAALTRQLLTFSRKQPIDSRSVRLDATVGELEPMLRRLLGAHIELDFALGSDSSCIRCDPSGLEQLVVNLALNARDAMPEGGRLRIETTASAQEPEQKPRTAMLVVSDTGVGMSSETRTRIFEPFFTTKPVGEGTGLGLSTAYAIVEQIGGEITVESAPSRGSIFTVRLPSTRPELEGSVDVAPAVERGGRFSATILLVEDEKAVRAVARAALEGAGHEVIEACDGEEALAVALSNKEIDAVVTDVIMPRRGGLSLIEALSASRPELPVLLISGYQPDPGTTLPAKLLTKPFTQAQLSRAVHDLLNANRYPGADISASP